jgi:hypothetical protein
MTQDLQQQIRERYIGEYIADAGAKKPGITGKIWRGVKQFRDDLALVKRGNREAYGMIAVLGPVGVFIGTVAAFGAAPVLGVALLAAEIGFAASYAAADLQVRREASQAIARDIADGKLDARFKDDMQNKTAPETQPPKLPAGGATAAQFAACAECAAPETDPVPPVRGIERPHGRNFG